MSRCGALALALAIASATSPALADGDPSVSTTGPSSPPGPLPSPTVSDEVKEEARQRFDRGVELFEEGDFRLALIEFERAYALIPDYRVLYNIAQVNLQLGRYAAARRALERYLEQAGDALPAARAKSVKRDLEMIAGRTAHLRVESNVEGAELLVDDAVVGTVPLSEPLLVDAGEHRVELRKPGYIPRGQYVKLASGDTNTLTLELEEAIPRTVVVHPPEPVLPLVVHEERPKWLWASWTATGVLAAGAAVTGLFGLATANELEREKTRPQATKRSLERLEGRARRLFLAADLAGVAALVTGGVSLYFTLAPQKVVEIPRRKAGLAARAQPGELGLELSSEF